MTLNADLKLAIFKSGRTQRAIAKQAGISENYLSQIVRGRVNASQKEQQAIAKALALPVAYLFGTSQERTA